MSFWTLSDNSAPKGDADSSHVKPMGIIPDGTQAPAQIKEFILAQGTDSYPYECYEVHFKIASGDFKGREVRLKVKCFDSKPHVADRGINMLKRIYDLCGHKPTHAEAPTEDDLKPMIGKIIGIKISEFIGTNSKTGEPSNGNYVSEIHPTKDFETVTGTKLEVTGYPTQKSSPSGPKDPLTGLPLDDSGIPF